ncbi:PD-(D/E)XK nuclease-like domain-containing protein [Brucella intermedia]|uniref:PD-(D/E)XK nuclease-like domain-containing protein n=1 Tax=Brucella intermedia TaxID=94625 RepID=UPI003AB541A3
MTFQSIGDLSASITAEAAEKAGFTKHPDGIYFGMSDAVYHADHALGSTGIKKLISNAPDFWWDSWMNPAREDDDTPAKIFGRQLHQCVLEGADKFKDSHAPQYGKGNTKEGKAEIADIVAAGKVPVKFKDYGRILAASAFIKANKTLANAFEGGQPEVSVFWTVDGTRFKARFDYLKMNAITDLKSLANPYGKEFDKACRDAVASYDYLVSAEHYSEGRRQMKRLHQEGKVFGSVDPEWLAKVAANEVFAFVFVFWQKDGAPVSHGIKLSPGNPLFSYARSMIAKATDNYRRFMAEFGTDAAWVPSTPLEELDETDLPVWYQQRLMTGS